MNTLPPWLDSVRAPLAGLAHRNQLPHGVLVHGPAGIGRHLLALWLIGGALGL